MSTHKYQELIITRDSVCVCSQIEKEKEDEVKTNKFN